MGRDEDPDRSIELGLDDVQLVLRLGPRDPAKGGIGRGGSMARMGSMAHLLPVYFQIGHWHRLTTQGRKRYGDVRLQDKT
jgi:hypothetical protein